MRGPSARLDPRTHAVRGDLADIRLARHVFAPHYAAPLIRSVASEATLRLDRDHASETLATLAPGDVFEVLEFAGDLAWGVAPSADRVGYVAAATLAPA